jgi:flagellar export protein FliJ
MAKFQYRMATLQRLRESFRDERRNHLAQAYRAEELVLRQIADVEGEIEQIRGQLRNAATPGEVNLDYLLSGERFDVALRAQKTHLEQQRELVLAEIERRRQSLIEADREVKVLEKLKERLHERWLAEENRQDIKRLDEVAQRRSRHDDEEEGP